MKNISYAVILAFVLTLHSCTKDKKVEENVTENTVRYIATDGTNVLVNFYSSDKENYINIKNNNYTVRAHKDSTAMKQDSIYVKDDVRIVAKNDSLFIEQGDQIIELRKAGSKKNP